MSRVLRGLCLLAAVAGVLATAAPVGAQRPPAEPMLVTFRSSAGLQRAAAAGGGLDRADQGSAPVGERVAVAALTRAEAAALRADPEVLAVEPDRVVVAADQPDDPCYAAAVTCPPVGAWHVDRMSLAQAWEVSHGTGALIAIIDGGLDEEHPVADLAGKIQGEIDLTGGAPECPDHATYGALLAAAATDNGIRMPGAGWDARILSIQALHRSGGGCDGFESRVIAGLNAAANARATVANLSLTTTGLSTAMRTTIDDVIARGLVVVAAAGNSGQSNPSVGDGGYPAAYPPVLAVGASTAGDARASFSNFGSWVDVFAPGSGLQDPLALGTISGTSYAAPLVSGVVALMRSVRPALGPAGVEVILRRTARVVNGVPRVDARRALHDTVFHDYVWPGPSALALDGNRVAVASRTVNGTIWHRTLGGRWANAGGGFVGDPDLTSAGPGRIDVVGRGLDNRAWYRRVDIGAAWVPLGSGRFNSGLTVTSPATGRLDVFGRGLDGALWHGFVANGQFRGWFTLGGSLLSEPDAASLGDGRIVVFAVGTDRAMWGRIFGGSAWSPWFSLGGGFSSGPGAAWSSGRLDVVARGLDGAVWLRTFAGSGWSQWTSLGGFVVSAPDLATRGPGSLDVVARAGDGLVWRRTLNAGSWTGWAPTD